MVYTWGEITADGQVRVWPMRRVSRGGGEQVFDFDQYFSGNLDEGVIIRQGDISTRKGKPSITKKRTPSAPMTDEMLEAYRQWALDRYSGIDLIGVGGGELRLGLEEIYIPLRIAQRSALTDLDERDKARRDLALESAQSDIDLTEIFDVKPAHHTPLSLVTQELVRPPLCIRCCTTV